MKTNTETNFTSTPDILDDSPENRELTAQRIVTFIKKTGIWEKAHDPLKRDEFISKILKPKSAEKFLERLNGIIVGTPIYQRKIYEHARGVINPETGELFHEASLPQFQEIIFNEIIIPTVNKLEPADAAEFSAAAINLLHSFQDGNGRLARVVYFLMEPDFGKLDEEVAMEHLKESLGPKKRGINFNPGLIYPELNHSVSKVTSCKDKRVFQTEDIANFERIEKESALLEEKIAEDNATKYAIARTIIEARFDSIIGSREYVFSKPQSEIEKFLVVDKNTNKISINADTLMDDMDSPENMGRWVNCYEKSKAWRIHCLADIFLNPDDYPSEEEGKNLKEYFEELTVLHYLDKE